MSGSTKRLGWSRTAGGPAVPDVELWLWAGFLGDSSASRLHWSQRGLGAPTATVWNWHSQTLLLLPETASLISRRLGNLGIAFWKCFDVSEVTFLGISRLWAFSKEFVSCLIWTEATSSDKTSFPANWRLGLPGSSSARAPSALLVWSVRFLCPDSRGSAVPWPVRLS